MIFRRDTQSSCRFGTSIFIAIRTALNSSRYAFKTDDVLPPLKLECHPGWVSINLIGGTFHVHTSSFLGGTEGSDRSAASGWQRGGLRPGRRTPAPAQSHPPVDQAGPRPRRTPLLALRRHPAEC